MSKVNCPSCGAEIKSKFLTLSTNELLSERQNKIISLVTGTEYRQLCDRCGQESYMKAQQMITPKLEELKAQLNSIISAVPVVTIHNPAGWEYEIVGLVTSQSATGTGVITELVSSFTDLIGSQSERHKLKLKAGEEICKNQLQLDAIMMGANAIIGVDIDYSEIGAGKGILMVCMAGTAIRIKNIGILGNKMTVLDQASPLITQIKDLQELA